MKKHKFEIEGFELVEKTVSDDKSSAGHISQDAVKRYILEQQGKSVFEYFIFGDIKKQTKIGDFTC